MLAAMIVTSVTEGQLGLTRLAKRCAGGGLWILIAILIPAGLFLLATAIIKVVYGVPIEWANVGRSTEFPDFSRSIYWVANVLFYGFGEEVGWRGFALPRLQSHASALRASLLLAVGSAGWHVPLFAFSAGLSTLGLTGAGGWFVSVVLGSILLTSLFNSSGGSVAVVALFHAALDIFISSPVAAPLPNVMGALLTVGTLVLIPVLGRLDLSRRPRVVEPACAERGQPVGPSRRSLRAQPFDCVGRR
jgi:membrane protease YdiL (CAAX protease family)